MKNKLFILSVVAMLSISPALVFGQAQRSGGNASGKQSASKTTTSNKQQGASAKTSTSASKQTNSTASKQASPASKQTNAPKADNKQQASAPKADNKQQASAPKADNKQQASAPKADNKKQTNAPKADNKKQTNAPKADNKKQASAPKSIPKGYEDKMRYDSKSGHWSYLREGKWYTYDHYIEPTVYYSRPLSEFGCALIGTVVGALISSLLIN